MNAHTLHATQTVARIVGGWRGAPPVAVVESPQDLPVPAPSDVRGLFHRGATWVVADTQPPAQIGATLAHEVLGHAAMRETLGASWRSFMHALQDGVRAGDQPMRGFRDSVARVYVDDKGECNLSSVQMGDEVTAAVVECRYNSATGRLDIVQPGRKVVMAAVGHVAREWLYLDRPASFDELEGALLAAEHRLRFGGAFYGLGYQLRRWYASRMPKFNPKAAPMSLAESERLLRNAGGSERAWRNFWFFLKLEFPILLGGLFFVGCLLAGGFWLLRVLGGL